MKEIIELKNGLKFVVLSKLNLEGKKYLYLSSYETEEIHFIFAEMNNDGTIIPIEDGEVVFKLMELVMKNIK